MTSEYQRRKAIEDGERPDNLLYTKWEAEAKAAARARREGKKKAVVPVKGGRL